MTKDFSTRSTFSMLMVFSTFSMLSTFSTFSGCMLFKKSTKSTVQNKLETQRQTYLEHLNLKTANKETNSYTYWNDSSGYQFQNIRENIEEVKHNTANTDKKQVLQAQQTMKKTEPPDLWVYGTATVVVFGVLILLGRFLVKK